MRIRPVMVFLLSGILTIPAWAETRQAIPRVGKSCPSGYRKSGDYCIQSTGSYTAIQRAGSTCPTGYRKSGDYCVTSSPQAPSAVTRQGSSCPTGYRKSGEYCVQSR